MSLRWRCHICGRVRPDAKISVFSSDTSADYDLPHGTVVQNVRYCNDNPKCIDAAKTFRFGKPQDDGPDHTAWPP